MIPDTALAPEVRCIVCGAPAGFNNDSHPNLIHTLLIEFGVWEYRIGSFFQKKIRL